MASLANTLFKAVNQLHIFLYETSGGKVWGSMLGFPVLIITSTGRKSGQTRKTPVVYIKDGEDFIIAASSNGQPKHPSWYYNIAANPNIKINVDGNETNVEAELLAGEERTRVYQMLKDAGDNFAKYEEKTQGIREIPVFRLKVQ